MAALRGEMSVFYNHKKRTKEESHEIGHGCIIRWQSEYQQLLILGWPFYYRFICADSLLAFCHSQSCTCKSVTFCSEFIGF